MIAGVEQVFHLVYELAHWATEWTVPAMEMIEVTDRGMKVSGGKVTELEPGYHFYHQRLSEIYTVNVQPRPHALPDQLLTTGDGKRVRAGGVVVYSISNLHKWMIENEDAEESVAEMAAHALREVIIEADFSDMQKAREQKRDVLTRSAQENLGQFGVRVEYLRLTTFAETDARDLHHSGSLDMAPAYDDEDYE